MKHYLEKAQQLSKKYYLDQKNFKIKKERSFFTENQYLVYGQNEFFFKKKNSNFYFFPFFDTQDTELETWLSSISKTIENNYKIIKGLEVGKKDRYDFKKKFNI